MTDEAPSHRDLPQEEDRIPWRKVFLAFGAMLAVIAALVVAAFSSLKAHEARLRPGGQFPEQELGPRRLMSEVHEDLFGASPGFGQVLNEQKRRALSSYGWVDRERRIIRIPVDQAMDVVVEEARR